MEKIERLGQYISEYSVRNKADEDIKVYSVTNTNGFCTEYFDKDVASKDQTNYKIVPRGYFAYNPSRINVGSIDCQTVEDRVIVSPLYVVFKADERVDDDYLLQYLKSDIGKKYINELASGSVRANLKFSILQDFPFPMVPIEEQKEKMKAIAKLDEIIGCCDSIIEKLDIAVKSRFIEMFENGKYPYVKASDVCEFITKGTTPPSGELFQDYEEGLIPYLKVYNLSFNGELLFDEEPQYISRDVHEGLLSRSKVYPNDVLMNIVGPPLGKFSLVNDEYDEWNINQAIAIFRAKDVIIPRFLLHALMQPNVIKPFIDQAVGVRQLNISLEQCRNLEFSLPPLENQNEFVRFSEEIDKSKLAVQEMKTKMEILKASVMQEYFC